jgi:hypothetical protein
MVRSVNDSVSELPADLTPDPIRAINNVQSQLTTLQGTILSSNTPARTPSATEKEVVPPTSPAESSRPNELAVLREEQEKIAERRRRLNQLLELDEQEEQVRQRISMLQTQSYPR